MERAWTNLASLEVNNFAHIPGLKSQIICHTVQRVPNAWMACNQAMGRFGTQRPFRMRHNVDGYMYYAHKDPKELVTHVVAGFWWKVKLGWDQT